MAQVRPDNVPKPSLKVAAADAFRYGDIKTVTLYVGKDRTAFQVHEDLLCQHSPVFKAAFDPNLDRTMTLPDDHAGLFDHIVHWLYTQQYPVPGLWYATAGALGESATPDLLKRYESWIAWLMQLFILAHKYDITGLKRHIRGQLLQRAKNGYQPPNLHTITYACEHLPAKCSMRRLLVDWYVSSVPPAVYEDVSVRNWLLKSPEFAVDCATALAKRASSAKDWDNPLHKADYFEETQPQD